MLVKSKRAKGKKLEDYVADELRRIDQYAYRRADSGSGLHRKEDVFTTLPFFIECKNQEQTNIYQWWLQTLDGCPANKYPVLIYKKNYQKEPLVVMKFFDMVYFLGNRESEQNISDMTMTIKFSEFINLINLKNEKKFQ